MRDERSRTGTLGLMGRTRSLRAKRRRRRTRSRLVPGWLPPSASLALVLTCAASTSSGLLLRDTAAATLYLIAIMFGALAFAIQTGVDYFTSERNGKTWFGLIPFTQVGLSSAEPWWAAGAIALVSGGITSWVR